ncbi:hypothetical protein DOZ91_06485 [Peribacillus frigoritolerans]|nr:hypothetical protein DOZ91_06485 [Peribacillus frigoritolerans]
MSPHKLRHIYGTNLMEQSGDIHLLMTWSYFNHNGCPLYKP